nr:uncharacterized protein CTRU02_13710 [Colletotrichum truncatum]KAF6783058.1 hypothetical protein CTRU02_13710 [Colletotrichum truncatum]
MLQLIRSHCGILHNPAFNTATTTGLQHFQKSFRDSYTANQEPVKRS